jgi:hypothetical protein
MISKNVVSLVALAVTLVGGSAFAEDYPQHTAAKARSLTTCLTRSSNPILTRNKGDLQATKTALLASLCGAACKTTETVSSAGNHVESSDWALDLASDGTQVSYVIKNAEARSSQIGLPSSSRMTIAALETAGRAFIASKLASVIELKSNEQLVAMTAAYRTETMQDRASKTQAPETVVANRIVFNRTIDGVPVVGGGSTVIVTFANDGSIESFRYDWPSYTTGSSVQTALAPSAIVSRVQTVVQARSSQPNAVTSIPSSKGTYPVALGPQTQLQDLECGYFDPGVNARASKAPVQTGCTYHVVETLSGGGRAAHGGAVPASTQIESDDAWPETALLTGKAGTNGAPPPASSP